MANTCVYIVQVLSFSPHHRSASIRDDAHWLIPNDPQERWCSTTAWPTTDMEVLRLHHAEGLTRDDPFAVEAALQQATAERTLG